MPVPRGSLRLHSNREHNLFLEMISFNFALYQICRAANT